MKRRQPDRHLLDGQEGVQSQIKIKGGANHRLGVQLVGPLHGPQPILEGSVGRGLDEHDRGVLAVALKLSIVLGDGVPCELPVEEAYLVGRVQDSADVSHAAENEEIHYIQFPELEELVFDGLLVPFAPYRRYHVPGRHVLEERLVFVVHD